MISFYCFLLRYAYFLHAEYSAQGHNKTILGQSDHNKVYKNTYLHVSK